MIASVDRRSFGFGFLALLAAVGAAASSVASSGGRAEVDVLDLRTGSLQHFAKTGVDDYEPAWSPDGKRLAFTRCCPGRRSLIYLTTVATGRTVQLPSSTGGCSASWSPTGKSIAFEGRGGVRVTDLTGRLQAVWKGSAPSWSPDGRRVAYVIPTAGIWIKNAD